jgi:hypothetical protein
MLLIKLGHDFHIKFCKENYQQLLKVCKSIIYSVRCEVFKAVWLKILVFWDVTLSPGD